MFIFLLQHKFRDVNYPMSDFRTFKLLLMLFIQGAAQGVSMKNCQKSIF